MTIVEKLNKLKEVKNIDNKGLLNLLGFKSVRNLDLIYKNNKTTKTVEKLINLLLEEVKIEKGILIIFSRDIQYIENSISSINKKDYYDVVLICLCKDAMIYKKMKEIADSNGFKLQYFNDVNINNLIIYVTLYILDIFNKYCVNIDILTSIPEKEQINKIMKRSNLFLKHNIGFIK